MLHDNFIAYYKNRDDAIPKGCLQLDQNFDVFQSGKLITIVTRTRRLVLHASTFRLAREWTDEITTFYHQSPRRLKQPYYSSFPVRSHTDVKLYLCGREYFTAAAAALLSARSEIMIASWMVSPTLLMTRYPFPPVRLDHILKLKADQGVKIYVLLYKEVTV